MSSIGETTTQGSSSTYLAEALDRVQPVSAGVFDALASPATSVSGLVVPRLAMTFAAMTSPVVLVIDDAHLLQNPECRSALSVLAVNAPPGSVVAIAAREDPPLRMARLRAEARITEVGAAELSLTRSEAGALLRAADVAVDEHDVAVLHERTGGGRSGCTWRRCTSGKAGRSELRQPRSAVTTNW